MLKSKILTLITAVVISTAFFIPQNVQATIYRGIDIYQYDNIQDWNQIKQSGVSVVIQKATQGLYHNDSLLYYRYPKILQTGFKIGYYHFANNSGDPVGEAQHFLSQVKKLHSDTVLWLDIENQRNWTKQQAVSYTNAFVNYVQKQGYKIGIYTGSSFYYEYLSGNIPSNIPIWLARYGKQPLQFPDVVSWQYSESGRVSGAVGDVDLDYFNDSIFTGIKPKEVKNSANSTVKNTSIANLQKQLNSLINAKLKIDGVNGPATKAAVEKFQSIMGLIQDGTAGTKTWNAINQIKSYPIDGVNYTHYEYATRWVQWRTGSSIDGKYGNGTALKVKDFQRNINKAYKQNLKIDGVVGKRTWEVMFKY